MVGFLINYLIKYDDHFLHIFLAYLSFSNLHLLIILINLSYFQDSIFSILKFALAFLILYFNLLFLLFSISLLFSFSLNLDFVYLQMNHRVRSQMMGLIFNYIEFILYSIFHFIVILIQLIILLD